MPETLSDIFYKQLIMLNRATLEDHAVPNGDAFADFNNEVFDGVLAWYTEQQAAWLAAGDGSVVPDEFIDDVRRTINSAYMAQLFKRE